MVAPLQTRLARNVTENRLKHKASKRDVAMSERRLLNDDKRFRLESLEGELPFENYIKINNADLTAGEVAAIIKERFDL